MFKINRIVSVICVACLNLGMTASASSDKEHELTCIQLYNDKNYSKAFQVCNLMENSYNHEVRFDLGYMYVYGLGTQQDYNKAFEHFNYVSQYDYPDAWFNLGIMYEHGRGTNVNMDQALYFYVKASDRGIAKASYNAGHIYADRINFDSAKKYLMRAVEKGYAPAFLNMGYLYSNPQFNQVNAVEAYAWYNMAKKDSSLRELADFNLKMVQKIMTPKLQQEGEELFKQYNRKYSVIPQE